MSRGANKVGPANEDSCNGVYSITLPNLQNNEAPDNGEVSEVRASSAPTMSARRSCYWRLLIDIPVVLVVATFYLVVELDIAPTNQYGFYCNDPLFSHKFQGDTVSVAALLIIGFLIPIAVILVTELSIYEYSGKNRRLAVSSKLTLYWYKEYVFAAIVNLLIVEVAKITVGSPRPHFFDTCRPDTNCTDPNEFISSFKCTNPNFTWYSQTDSYRSFPSGHTSFAILFGFFLAWYLQKRVQIRHSRSMFLVPLVQSTLVCVAIFIALSRITDHRHHWWDVLFGALLGLATVYYACQILCNDFTLSMPSSSNESISHSDSSGPHNDRSVRRLISSQSEDKEAPRVAIA